MPLRLAVPCSVQPTLLHPPLASALKKRKCLCNAYPIMCTGSIRGDYALAVGRNICHGSDSVESAEKEIALCAFFFLNVYPSL